MKEEKVRITERLVQEDSIKMVTIPPRFHSNERLTKEKYKIPSFTIPTLDVLLTSLINLRLHNLPLFTHFNAPSFIINSILLSPSRFNNISFPLDQIKL
jgi:hypothetical protein